MRGARDWQSLGLVVLAAALLSCDDDDDDEPSPDLTDDLGGDPDFETGLTFREPEQVRSDDGLLRVTLRAQRQSVSVSDARVVGSVFNGEFVGPTLRVRPGDRMEITLENRLTQPLNLHFHGMHVSPEGVSDNVFRLVAPGEDAIYLVDVPANHPEGVFWYHSHMHMLSEQQVFGGLSGVIIVDGLAQRLPPAFQGADTRLFALKDLQVKNRAILAEGIDSNAPTTRTVNGLVQPELSLSPGETERWQFANIGADIFYNVALEQHRFLVIGEDGNPVAQTWMADSLVLPPGKRYEVLVQAGSRGTYGLRTLAYDQGGDMYPDALLATIEVEGEARTPVPLVVEGLVPLDNLLFAPVARQRIKVFSQSEDDMSFFINGQQFDMTRIDDEVKLGTVEEWVLRNDTDEQHPFHIHVNDFQVMSIDGRPYEARGRQDTVILPPRGEVVVRIPFDDFTGRFVYHCHILGHEDGGMMAVVQVLP